MLFLKYTQCSMPEWFWRVTAIVDRRLIYTQGAPDSTLQTGVVARCMKYMKYSFVCQSDCRGWQPMLIYGQGTATASAPSLSLMHIA